MTAQKRTPAGTPAGGRFAPTARKEAQVTLDAPCPSSGKPIRSWSGKMPWPPVRQVRFGDGEMTGAWTCERCKAEVTARRAWKRGVPTNDYWVLDEHLRPPHTTPAAASSR